MTSMGTAYMKTGKLFYFLIGILHWNIIMSNSCEFFPLGEYLRFVRIPENFPVGESLLRLRVHNKRNLTLESVDKGDDSKYFGLHDDNGDMVDIKLAKSLENIVDNDRNILKFRLSCFPGDSDTTPNYLSISVFVEDVNNHRPKFLKAPYHLTVDELTPVGLNIFREIRAIDLDKPNTPNSDIKYSITDGNEKGKFSLESGHNPGLILSKGLDYDTGDREFKLVILATDRGSPPLSTNATVFIRVKDNDDLPVAFKHSIYTTRIKEFYPITNESIRQVLKFQDNIQAMDQDLSINARIVYDITAGNELGLFEIEPSTGKIFLVSQLDRERLPNDVMELTIRARQVDAFSKFGTAKVIVEVLDINDNLPQFEHMTYNISIMENLPNGFSVLQVFASDADKDQNREFVYKLDDPRKAFTIDAQTGWLTVLDETKLDREELDFLALKISTVEMVPNVANNGKTQGVAATVTIGLLDANDNSPTFTPSNLFHFEVTVDAEIGSVVGQVTAEDADVESNGNGRITYEIQKSNSTAPEELPFDIDSKNGYIFLLERPLPKRHYTILIEASDQPSNPSEKRFSLAVVQIDVVKADSRHSPEFVGSPYEFWVGTTVGIGTSVGQVKVKDLEPKHTVYDLLHSYYEGVPFAIEERTGIIAVVDELTKFSRHHYDFEAYVTDSRHTLTTNVSIHVVDPVNIVSTGSSEPIQLSVQENVGGAVLANLRKLFRGRVEDTRGMEFLLANYELRDKFAISNDGTIFTLKELDREEKQEYLLTVIAQNRGVIQGQGIYQVVVHVRDENDNKPQFEKTSYEGRVRENSPPGTPVTTSHPVKVTDRDEGVNAEFKVEIKGDGWDRFRVDPSNGRVYVGNLPLDREEKFQYNLELVARDTGNLSSSVPLRITIDDLNDNAPVFERNLLLDPPEMDSSQGPREFLRASSSQPISMEVSSMEPVRIPETTEVGTKIARVLAFDRDSSENAIVFYRIVSENSNTIGNKFEYLTDKEYLISGNLEKHFGIDRTSGEISVSKPLNPNTEYAVNISASDRGGLRSYTGVKVVVYDVNTFHPVFRQSSYSFETLEGSTGVIGKVVAFDADTGLNGRVTYSLRSKIEGEKIPFEIHSSSGEITINGKLDRESCDKYFLLASAKDGGSPPLEGMAEVNIEILDRNDNRPQFQGFTRIVGGENGEQIPLYETTIRDDVPPGTNVATIFANDSDSTGNGHGLVLLHLNNHHREFYLDSKNGTIVTASKLNYHKVKEYNLTIVASDLGNPSQSSTAWALVKVIDSGKNRPPLEIQTERIFNQPIYAYQVPQYHPLPFLLTVLNVTEKFRKHPTTFEVVGERSVVSKFRVDPTTGAVLLLETLEDSNKILEFTVRAHNALLESDFDTSQKKTVGQLGLNEAMIRVRRIPSSRSAVQPNKPLEPPRPSPTHEPTPEAAEPVIITKGTPRPRLFYGKVPTSGPQWPVTNVTTAISDFDAEEEHQGNTNFYAGEVAVLSLSGVIFIGGLIAAIVVACVRNRRQHRHLPTRHHHHPILSGDVRLQKQLPPSARMSNGPTRPILFPMALPTEPLGMMMTEEGNSSDQTSDTYTDSAEVIMGHGHKAAHALHKAGYSICPDCRKVKRPKKKVGRGENGVWRDIGPMKQLRTCGMREVSLDSGIEGSDGQCNCFKNRVNHPSLFSEQTFEDSLMIPEEAMIRNPGSSHTTNFGKNNLNFSHRNKKGRISNRPEAVIL